MGNSKKQDELARQDSKKSKLECRECSVTFFNPKMLSKHRRLHLGQRTNHPCQTCGQTFISAGNLELHMMIHATEKTHPCDFCNKTFALKKQLDQHVRVHQRQMIFQCPLCPFRFSTLDEQRQHSSTHHSTSRADVAKRRKRLRQPAVQENYLHRCGLCLKYFAMKSTLEIHFKKAHAHEELASDSMLNNELPSALAASWSKREIDSADCCSSCETGPSTSSEESEILVPLDPQEIKSEPLRDAEDEDDTTYGGPPNSSMSTTWQECIEIESSPCSTPEIKTETGSCSNRDCNFIVPPSIVVRKLDIRKMAFGSVATSDSEDERERRDLFDFECPHGTLRGAVECPLCEEEEEEQSKFMQVLRNIKQEKD